MFHSAIRGTGEHASDSPIIKPFQGKSIGFVFVIILGLGGLAVAGVGLSGYLRAGTLSDLGQVNSIIMMASGGGGGILFLIVGIIGSVKNHNAARNQSVENRYNEIFALLDALQQALSDSTARYESIKQVMQEVKRKKIDIYAVYQLGDRRTQPIIRLLISLIHVDILRSLVKDKLVDLTGDNEMDGSPLYIACQPSVSPDLFQFILEQSSDEMLDKAPHEEGATSEFIDYTPLCLAIFTDQMDKAKALLERGAEPNLAYKGSYPIHFAIMQKNLEIVALLIQKGAPLYVPHPLSHTLLWCAADVGSREIYAFLLERGHPEDIKAAALLEKREEEARVTARYDRDRQTPHQTAELIELL